MQGALRLAPVAGTGLCVADRVSVEDLWVLGSIGTDPNSMVPRACCPGPVITRARLPGTEHWRHGHPFRPIPSSRGGHSFPERGVVTRASARVLAPSLRRMASTWWSTVYRTGDHEAVAIWPFCKPSFTNASPQLTGSEPVLVLEGSRTGAARQRHHSPFAQSSGQHRRRRAGRLQQLLQRQPQPRLVVGVGQAEGGLVGAPGLDHDARAASQEPASCKPWANLLRPALAAQGQHGAARRPARRLGPTRISRRALTPAP